MQQVHKVFHMSLIKQYRADGRTQPPPHPDLVDDCPEWTVQQVLDHRVVRRGRQRKIKYLISWVGYAADYNIWETAANASNAAELAREYWLTQPANCRLAASAVTYYAGLSTPLHSWIPWVPDKVISLYSVF